MSPPPQPRAKTSEIAVELDELVVRLMAKSPADRPWDAAAVGQTLRELREKVNRGDTVKMAWPTETDGGSYPTRLGLDTPKSKAKSSKKGSRSSQKGRFGLPQENRTWIGTALMVLALVLIGGFLGYMLWPPSAGYLYNRAKAQMASTRRADWIVARDEFLDPLDQRFPDHPYRQETQGWRDRILLYDAEVRAKALSNLPGMPLGEPKNDDERTFVGVNTLAKASSENGDDRAAAARWETMANQMQPDDPDQRQWFLLARGRAEGLKRAIAQREEDVAKLLTALASAERDGQLGVAKAIRRGILSQYGKYNDVRELLKAAGLPDPPEPSPPTPAPRATPEPAGTQETGPAPE
jgi:serine/threonine-protein kinase